MGRREKTAALKRGGVEAVAGGWPATVITWRAGYCAFSASALEV